jgi:hypothetical protein
MTSEINHSEKKSFFQKIKDNKLLTSILLGLVIIAIILIYFNIKVSSLEKKHNRELENTISIYQNQIDSLNLAALESTVRVFSWAIRSEMSRNNMEEVNRFFLEMVQYKHINKISMIDPQTSMVIVSTDKKDEGYPSKETVFISVNQMKTVKEGKSYKIFQPIMGIDRKLGILLVEGSIQ